jgi:hypothetical protein
MANEILARRYTADKGGAHFTLGVEKEVALQDDGGDPAALLIGGGLANVADYPFPQNMKPRRARCVGQTSGKVRYVPLLTPTAPLATAGTEIVIEDSDGAAETYESERVVGEEYRNRTKLTPA